MADPVADLRRRLVDPVAVHEEECHRIGLEGSAGVRKHGPAHMEWWLRNLEAIRMLQEAERLLCKDRAEALLYFYDRLDPEALPADFDRRLLLAIANTRDRAGAGIREARNEKISRLYSLLLSDEAADAALEMGKHPYDKTSARKKIAEMGLLGVGQIRNVVRDHEVFDTAPRSDDFRRLSEKRQLLISEANN